ncbi:MAG: aminoacyl-tRNA hydrolase [Chlamydiia bacterium]|nr:aminoacyl-tRNA hydrolase [Chlamydiia bacterium]
MFIGLGNPGPRYASTRHNIGWKIIEAFAKEQEWGFKENSRFEGLVAKGVAGGCQVHLLLPTTYMNLSGRAVRKYREYHRITAAEMCVVSDEVALSLGQLRLNPSGSAGGHNGLLSVEQELGTRAYPRLRVGIGAPEKMALEAYVLAPFTPEEKEAIPEIISQGKDVLTLLLQHDLSDVMNRVNVRKKDDRRKNKSV